MIYDVPLGARMGRDAERHLTCVAAQDVASIAEFRGRKLPALLLIVMWAVAETAFYYGPEVTREGGSPGFPLLVGQAGCSPAVYREFRGRRLTVSCSESKCSKGAAPGAESEQAQTLKRLLVWTCRFSKKFLLGSAKFSFFPYFGAGRRRNPGRQKKLLNGLKCLATGWKDALRQESSAPPLTWALASTLTVRYLKFEGIAEDRFTALSGWGGGLGAFCNYVAASGVLLMAARKNSKNKEETIFGSPGEEGHGALPAEVETAGDAKEAFGSVFFLDDEARRAAEELQGEFSKVGLRPDDPFILPKFFPDDRPKIIAINSFESFVKLVNLVYLSRGDETRLTLGELMKLGVLKVMCERITDEAELLLQQSESVVFFDAAILPSGRIIVIPGGIERPNFRLEQLVGSTMWHSLLTGEKSERKTDYGKLHFLPHNREALESVADRLTIDDMHLVLQEQLNQARSSRRGNGDAAVTGNDSWHSLEEGKSGNSGPGTVEQAVTSRMCNDRRQVAKSKSDDSVSEAQRNIWRADNSWRLFMEPDGNTGPVNTKRKVILKADDAWLLQGRRGDAATSHGVKRKRDVWESNDFAGAIDMPDAGNAERGTVRKTVVFKKNDAWRRQRKSIRGGSHFEFKRGESVLEDRNGRKSVLEENRNGRTEGEARKDDSGFGTTGEDLASTANDDWSLPGEPEGDNGGSGTVSLGAAPLSQSLDGADGKVQTEDSSSREKESFDEG